MTTDRELLELAAKAAGIYYDHAQNTAMCKPWNPLTDDGDALRLAVKLGIDLDMYGRFVCCKRSSDYDGGEDYEWQSEEFNNDHYAATRRAIVRAAAEIWKEMK